MKKHPTKPGLYWASLNDGNGSAESLKIEVIRVDLYAGHVSFDEGAVCSFPEREGDSSFEVPDFASRIVKPSHTNSFAGISAVFKDQEFLITWLGPVRPPAAVRNAAAKAPGAPQRD